MTIRDDFIFEDDPGGLLSVGCPLEALAPTGSRDPEEADASVSETGVTPIAELKPLAELLRASSSCAKSWTKDRSIFNTSIGKRLR